MIVPANDNYRAIYRALDTAREQRQPASRVHAFIEQAGEMRFKARSLATVLGVSESTVRKVAHTHFGLRADEKGWFICRGAK